MKGNRKWSVMILAVLCSTAISVVGILYDADLIAVAGLIVAIGSSLGMPMWANVQEHRADGTRP